MAQPIALAPTRERQATKGSDFAPLLREIKDAGLLERRTASYVIAITLNVALLAATWAGVVLLGNSWLQLLLTIPLAIFTTRAAFFGHDAGHQQMGSSRKLHDVLGMLHGNFVCGMSYGWWNDKHNRHHANPNHTDKDPDVGEGVLVWTLEQAEGRTGLVRLADPAPGEDLLPAAHPRGPQPEGVERAVPGRPPRQARGPDRARPDGRAPGPVLRRAVPDHVAG